MKHLTLLILFCSVFVSAQNKEEFFNKADRFFNSYVQNGKVNYAEIKQNSNQLQDLLNLAKAFKPNPSEEEEYKAFWINAYNLAVIDGIVEKYPIGSPLEIDGFFEEQRHSLGQQSVTLDEVEHELLLKKFPAEERFHFALVCAAKGCPALRSGAYLPEKLNEQLLEQTRNALNDPKFIKAETDKVLLSEIFKWYRKDFTRQGNSLVQYINQYRKTKLPIDTQVAFYDYNWELNDF